jgi:hypothetical protein
VQMRLFDDALNADPLDRPIAGPLASTILIHK